jgi:c-di-GMP-binding flagellar brake protein YcgR
MAKINNAVQPDRRKSPRFAVPESVVYYSTPFIPRFLRAPKGMKHALVNISAGGMQFICDTYLRPGKKLSLLVTVPAFLGSMMFRGRVIWAHKIPERRAYRIGVEFIRMERESRAKLSHLRRDISFRAVKKAPPPGQAQ